jgi:ubiquinone biosynthesis protein UbiJ
MEPKIKQFLKNFITEEEKKAQVYKEIKYFQEELARWDYALKILNEEITEEDESNV